MTIDITAPICPTCDAPLDSVPGFSALLNPDIAFDSTPIFDGISGLGGGTLLHIVENPGGTWTLTANGQTVTLVQGPLQGVLQLTDSENREVLFAYNWVNPYGQFQGEWVCPPAVPEPTTWALFALGIGLLAGFRKLRRSVTK